MKKNYLLLILFILISLGSFAQSDKTFWFVIPHVTHTHANIPTYFRVSAGAVASDVTISMPANSGFTPITVNVQPNETKSIEMTSYIYWSVESGNPDADKVENKGFLITATNSISAYYEVLGKASGGTGAVQNAEIFALKGNNALGTKFYTPFQTLLDNSGGADGWAEFDVVATEDNTTVTITPTQNIVGHAAGTTFTVTLNKGQTWSGKAISKSGPNHPNGTVISSNKPIAVTVTDDSVVQNTGWDVVGDQIVPVSVVGTEYIVVKGYLYVPNGNSGDRAIITATQDNTVITIGGVVKATINAGQSYNYQVTLPSEYIATSNPAYVYHLSGNGDELGAALLPPIVCTGSSQVGVIRDTDLPFYLNILVKTGGEGNFTIKNSATGLTTTIPSGSFSVVPGTPVAGEWKAASIQYNTTDFPSNSVGLVTNSSAFFHLGLISGDATAGASLYGYFSDYSGVDGGTTTPATSTICSGTSTTLSVIGNTGSIQWQQSSTGVAASFVNVTGGSGATTSSYTTPNLTSTTYYRIEAKNGSCAAAYSTTATVTIRPSTSTADAGPDQTNSALCGLTSTTLAAAAPAQGTGAWSIVSGAGGSITTASSNTSAFSGTAGTTYVLRWTVTNAPCSPTTDDVTITFGRNPTTANAGADQTGASMCGLTSTTLAGNAPAIGTGAWSIVSGAGGSFGNSASNTSTFSGTAGTTYVLRWTIANSPCTSSTDDVTIKFNQNPTASNAGADQTGASTCGLTSVTLAGNAPSAGVGAWTIVSGAGGSIGNSASNTSTFDGTAGSTYTLRWTITNAPCAASSDDITVKFNQNPSAAFAGADQNGSALCGQTSTTLAATAPAIGTGTWTIQSGTGGSITTPSSNTSAFTGVAGNTYTLRWTVANSPCTSTFDDVVVIFPLIPTPANAGADQTGAGMCGLTNTTLAGNAPTVGTGTWSIVSGAGGSITTPGSNTSTFSGVAGNTYVLRWTIANSPCTSSTDDVTITFQRNPTTSAAGSDQNGSAMCGLTSTNLAGNAPAIGTGAWSIVSGAGGNITTASSNTSAFSGTAGTTYVLRWTVTNAPCTSSSDDVTVTFQQNPTTANAGADQTAAAMCGLTSTTLAGNAPTIGTGTWSIVSGAGGSITTASSNTSAFSGTAGTTYVLRWTIANSPCTSSSDDVTITFQRNPTTANASADQTGAAMCGLTSTTLAGNSPAIGTGAWSIVSGAGGSITTASSNTSTFSGTAGTAYVLRWTISNAPCTASSDDVTITFQRNPTASNAGADQTGSALCGLTSTTLAGNAPAIGTGSWSIVSGAGGTITTASSNTSAFSGTAGTTYVLRWTIANSPCTSSTDDVTITFPKNPTTSNAGADQTGAAICGLTSTTLSGNAPAIGTGAWSIVSGVGGSIATASSNTSTFSGTAGNSYTLRWTISNAPCSSSSDDVVIKFQQNPTTANAGADQTGAALCGLTSTTLAGNAPAIGTGTWSIVSGAGGSVATASSNTSAFSGTAGNSYTLRWTITNSPCNASSDDVIITFPKNPTTSNAGADKNGAAMCGLTVTNLTGNAPAVGTGAWSIVSGAGGSITTPSSNTSAFSGTAGTTYVLRWTISNAPCTSSSDDVSITFQRNPTTSNAGADQTGPLMCGLTSTTLSAIDPVIGTSSWSIISGAGGTVVTGNDNNSVFNGVAGNTYVLRWTTINAPCTSSSDDVTVTFKENPTAANAGNDQNVCSGTAVLGANSPVIGTGKWTLISGSGTLSDDSQTNSGVSGLASGANVFRWTISNLDCTPSSDNVTVTRDTCPIVANFTISSTAVCIDNPVVTFTDASIGATGYVWNFGAGAIPPTAITAGPHIVTYSTVGTKTVSLAVVGPGGANTKTSTNVIEVKDYPTVANAGPDQKGPAICGLTTATLAGNIPTVGTGIWTIQSGAGGSLSDPTNNATSFTGIAGNTYLLRWTISNGTCTDSFDEMEIKFQQNPTVSSAGADKNGNSMCNLTNVSLSGNTPVIGTGLWSVKSGAGYTITDASNPLTNFTGVAGTTYELYWTVSNAPCASSRDSVIITFQQNPTVATAGADQKGSAVCGLTTVALGGNTPTIGIGTWTIKSGAGGNISNPNTPNSNFSGIAGATYELYWTVSNSPCASSRDSVIITFQQNPTIATAGADQKGSAICGLTNVTLDGNNSSIGSGKWTIKSGNGGTLTDDTNPKTGFSGIAGATYELLWTITNAPCTKSADSVIVTFQQNPAIIEAGADQTGISSCGLTTVNLGASTPTVGVGTWSVKSGIGGSFGGQNNPTSTFTGTAGTAYELYWTVANAPCKSVVDSVKITFNRFPEVAVAGADQTGASTCDLTTVTLAGNNPAVGTGKWTVKSGFGGSFNSNISNNSTFSGLPGKTYELYWTVSNSPCPNSIDSVTVTFQQNPTHSLAGADQTDLAICGLTNVNLGANVATVGIGAWSPKSGVGGTITDPSNPASSFSGVAGSTYELYWTVTNAPCKASVDSVTITFQQNPATIEAGPDQTDISTCGNSNVTLAASNPSIGSGEWSVKPGPSGGAFVDKNNPVSIFSGTPGTAYTLYWTVSNSPCKAVSDSVKVTFNENPTVAIDVPDQSGSSTCGLTSVTLNANKPSIGIGKWSIITGINGILEHEDSASTIFTGIPGASYKLRWTVSNNPCVASSDDVEIKFNQNPDKANAGGDLNGADICGALSTVLSANTPVVGIGTWTINDPNALITEPHNPATSFVIGAAGAQYILYWTISNPPCGSTVDSVEVILQEKPSISIAGADIIDSATCGLTTIKLAGNNPAVGIGTWSVLEPGGSTVNPKDPNTSFTGLADSTYHIIWTIDNSPCKPSRDTLVLKFNQNPTVAIAGADQNGSLMCGLTTINLSANKATIGTGTWTSKGNTGTIASPNLFNTSFSGNPGSTHELYWTVANAPCKSSKDTVIVTFQQNPDTAIAGADSTGQNMCGLISIKLSGNTPLVGNGTWSFLNPLDGIIDDPNNPNSMFTGTPGKTYDLLWTVTNNPCTLKKDTVKIAFPQNPTKANAGADQTGKGTCGATDLNLAGNNPGVGIGTWTIKNGTGGNVISKNAANSNFKGVAGETYTLVWTITNAPCQADEDEVMVKFNEKPTPADAGADQVGSLTCGLTSINLAAKKPTIGTGMWAIVQPSLGGNLNSVNAEDAMFSGNAGTTYGLIWTVSNAPCDASSDPVAVRFNENPSVSDAGTVAPVCISTPTATFAANTPSIGFGTWSLVSGSGSVGSPNSGTSAISGLGLGVNVFRWTIKNTVCDTSSSTVSIKVDSVSKGGIVSSEDTHCAKINSGTITLSGYRGNIVRWESSIDHFTTKNDTANTSTSLNYLNLNDSTWYRAIVQNGSCPPVPSQMVAININPVPLFQGTVDTNYCEDAQLILKAQAGFKDYSWQDNSKGPNYIVIRQGSYVVKAYTMHNCLVADTINVDFCNKKRFIPNVFTPNKDGKNDTWVILGLRPNTSVEIYNRWGTLVYTEPNYQNNWDGADSSDGIYYYIASHHNEQGEEIKETGYLEIIR